MQVKIEISLTEEGLQIAAIRYDITGTMERETAEDKIYAALGKEIDEKFPAETRTNDKIVETVKTIIAFMDDKFGAFWFISDFRKE